MTNRPGSLQPAPLQPAPILERPDRLPTIAIPWILMGLFVAALVGEFAIVNTWEHGNCNIDGALGFAALVFILSGLVPTSTLVQQLRSPAGFRRVGQAVTIYVLSVLILWRTVIIAFMPIVFADAC